MRHPDEYPFYNKRMQLVMVLLFSIMMCPVAAQQGADTTHTYTSQIRKINALIASERFDEALAFVYKKVDSIIAVENYYYVTEYTYYIGRLEKELHGEFRAIKAVQDFEKRFDPIEKDSAKAMRQFQIEKASWYEFLGDSHKALAFNKKALEYTSKMKEATGKDYGLIYNNIGILYERIGQFAEGSKYKKKTLEAYLSIKNIGPNYLYNSYNSLGGSMWYQSKMDSAAYYFTKAEKMIDLMQETPLNTYYRRASVQNNLSAVYGIQGDIERSSKIIEEVILNINKFLESEISDVRRRQAYTFLFQAIENYGGLFKQKGDYKQALKILEYAYERKSQYFDPGNRELANAKILTGEAHLDLKNYDQASLLFKEAIDDLTLEAGYVDIAWTAMAHYDLARLEEERGKVDKARTYYNQAEQLFAQTQLEGFDEIYLRFIEHVTRFYADNGNPSKALDMANTSYAYIQENQGKDTVLEFDHALNLAYIHYGLEMYNEAYKYSQDAENILKTINEGLTDFKQEERRAQLIVLDVKISIALGNLSTVPSLVQKSSQIDEAISLLEQRKAFIYSEENSSLLLERNQELFEIAKELAFRLYEKTNDTQYLTALLNYTESGLYHRIRSRLNTRNNVQFNAIPPEVTKREQQLREQINNVLNSVASEGDKLKRFTNLNTAWESYLDSVRVAYPKYYDLRYTAIDAKIKDVHKLVPEQQTLIRYIRIGQEKESYAILIDQDTISIFEIQLQQAESLIMRLLEDQFDEAQVLENLYKLYQIVWQPFEQEIKTNEVVVIPDGALYNLSFESLLRTKSDTYKDLAINSLLATYTISYNYSSLLTTIEGAKTFDKDFIAFTPEFTQDMKSDYQQAIQDSLRLDQSYLTLLPQPFSVAVAQDYAKEFNGNHLKNSHATKQQFIDQANDHKIIHIGTHAESNNLSPEFSKLIFAKTIVGDSIDQNNALFTYEIYKYDLTSQLALLTACETGKPGYQSGEGMISLAHAFNYAGSESILTSLWKIDEQSSAEIVSYFYDNLKEGMRKDVALKEAKLQYLATAQGRTLQPNYWAGLVLIGDVAPLEIDSGLAWWKWMLIGVGVLVLFLSIRNMVSKAR